ncbi:Phage integrase family site specific recombinase [Saccharothrix espanaensis DSM 44229]|uniref:Phage integrase family site specific recombinase n=2 Tax=Saccharothrix espanaensis TaxID=103731 RepID=K0JV00_SACES|nr:Phage integrase family site specific recombinase [Saccharothrix espanaensis DSM 44229]
MWTRSLRLAGCVVWGELERLTRGLPRSWAGFMRDWDRSLRSANRPETTRYNYLLAVSQLARFLADEAVTDLECVAAAEDPVEVRRGHVELFQVWMIESRSAATALNKHKGLQQFFKWLWLDEEEIERSPMERVRQPKVTRRLIPVIRDEDTGRVLATCKGKEFVHLRDEAIIRLYYNTGARLSEVGDLRLEDVDLDRDTVVYRGKGGKERRVRFGPRTGRALSRYLRARDRHVAAGLPDLWLAERGRRALAPNGIKLMLKRRGRAAGVAGVHAHRWRHNFAHEWKRAGGDTGDLMLLLGWESEDMPRHYGASAAAERAQESQTRMGIGENV